MRTGIAVLLAVCGIGLTISACTYKATQEYKENNSTHTLSVSAEDTTEDIDLSNYGWTFNNPLGNIKDSYATNSQRTIAIEYTYTESNRPRNAYQFIIYAGTTKPGIKTTSSDYLVYTNSTGTTNTTAVLNNTIRFTTDYRYTVMTPGNTQMTKEQFVTFLNNFGTLTNYLTLITPTITKTDNVINFSNIDSNATNIEIYRNEQLYTTIESTQTSIEIPTSDNGAYKIRVINGDYYSNFSNRVDFLTYEELVNFYINGQQQLIQNQNTINNQTSQINELTTQLNNANNTISQQQTTIANLQNAIDMHTGTYEAIDLRGLMLDILAMPWAFISQAFNVTLWENTPYEINFSNIFMGFIAIMTLLFIVRLFTNGFNALGSITNSTSETKLNNARAKESLSKAKLNDRTDPNNKTTTTNNKSHVHTNKEK